MLSTIGFLCVLSAITLHTTSIVDCVPVSPCPRNFYYEYDGQQWLGVVKVYQKVYNGFRTNKFTTIVSLLMNGHIPDEQNFGSLDLYHSLTDTYRDIAARRPIVYRINFPYKNVSPALLEIQVNGLRICSNRLQSPTPFVTFSKIQLKHTFHLPVLDDSNEELETVIDHHQFNFGLQPANAPLPILSNHLLNMPKVVMSLDRQPTEAIDVPLKHNSRLLDRLEPTTAGCGTYDEKFKYTQLISGGENMAPGTWPWLVAVFRKEEGSGIVFQCTGNLISNRVVLTAAHCFKMYSNIVQLKPNETLLAFGQHDIRDWTRNEMILSDVDDITLHPDYMRKDGLKIFDADIAIMITKNFIKYNALIKPICLWPAATSTKMENANDIIGLSGTLVGWGQPYENLNSNVPRRLTLPIVPNQSCFPTENPKQSMLNGDGTKKRIFCAGTQHGSAPCNGDSGSGLGIWQNGAWFLRGIVSAALGDPILNRCDLNTFVIFTDITQFRSWIDTFL